MLTWYFLRDTWIPLVVFVVVAIGVPVFGFVHDRRRGTPLRPRTIVGYVALGLMAGAATAGWLVTPPELRHHPPPPGMR